MSTVRRAAVVLTAVSALALTACGPSQDDASGGGKTPGPGASASASASPSTAPTASAKPTPPSTTAPAPTATGGGSTDPDYDVFPCSTFDVKFTASLAEPTTGSYLLKVTNKSTKPCRVLGHPVVTFGDLDGQATQRGTAPGIEDAFKLAPGESAYAGLMGGAHDGKGRTVDWIAMTMDTSSDLVQTPLKAPTPGLYVSPDKNSVTPWVTNAEDALSL
ncbi:DUF4232 domain-containing protein [Streptomyces sp. NPDC101118]|uniref:DUF4232 domain-containing protein n=1 Tax=Streptomyces sp. NPDC101118 TaxID=3366109 RepID=UPI00380E03CC